MGKTKSDKQKIEEIRQNIAKQYKDRFDELKNHNKHLLIKSKEDEIKIAELEKTNKALYDYCKQLEQIMKLSDGDKEVIKKYIENKKAKDSYISMNSQLFDILNRYL